MHPSSESEPGSQETVLFLSDRQATITVNWERKEDERKDFFEVITIPVQIEVTHRDVGARNGSHQDDFESLSRLVEEYLTAPHLQDTSQVLASLQLVLPTKKGFGVRGNAFRDQLNAYAPLVRYLDNSGFAVEYHPRIKEPTVLADVLPLSICTVLVDPILTSQSDVQFHLSQVVSFPWLVESPPQWRRCALVHGRDTIEAFQPIAETAHDLGIKLLVLDRPGHWLLENPKYRYLYELFEPIDMTIDEDFPRRIAHAVQKAALSGFIDGICTVSDRCLLPVSKAASTLDLPTDLPCAFATAINKAESRRICADKGIYFLSVRHPAELKAYLTVGTYHAQYPLIVKPSIGWSSEHVFKVKDEAELCLAAERVATRPNTQILIEPFVDGPEVDANFILCDGEILFFEASDDFPSPADRASAGMESNFFETANVLPSGLPPAEIDLLRTRLHRLLLDMGFRTGVFHLEARIMDSSMEFKGDHDGFIDLRPRPIEQRHGRNPKCFLIEINPRPPGFQSVYATRLMYGVDYFALHLLNAVGDKARAKALGQSFQDRITTPLIGRCWCSIVFITGGKGGRCISSDPVGDLLARWPSLKPYITLGMSFFKEGDEVPDATPERLVFLGFFLVLSRAKRVDVIEVAERIQREFRMEVV